MPVISSRTQALGTENAFVVLKEVNDLIAQGKNVVSFCIGQPDFPTPKNVCLAANQAISEGKTGYTASAGVPELRKAVAEYFSRTRNIKVNPDSVVVAAGAKPFIGYAILACTDAHQNHEVIYPNPGFPIYESQILAHHAVPVPLPLEEKKNFRFDLKELKKRITDKTRLLILNSPQNPTGGILTRSDLKRIAELALEHDFWIYSDEVYSQLVYDGRFESIASIAGMPERTILVDGVSKTYAMTGWRIGFAANEKLANYFTTWITNTESCASHPAQYAALEALTGPQDQARKMADIFKARRDVIVQGLNEIPGFKCLNPGGAFYVYPNVTEACRMIGAQDSEELRKKLLYEAGVAVLADIHFGQKIPSEGEHLRFSYATSNEGIKEGLRRIKEFMEKKRGD